MRQQTLASQLSFEKYGRKSRRELFLDEMERVVPWPELEALVEPHYPKAGSTDPRAAAPCPPSGCETLPRLDCIWFSCMQRRI